LDLALKSVTQQTFTDYEVLVIDDASTDGSLEAIRRHEKACPRIRVIAHEKNLGLAATLNEGLEAARGNYVARMDQDDESLPDRLMAQAAFLDANPKCAVVGSFVYHMGASAAYDRLVALPVTAQEIANTLPNYNCMYHPATMLRRQTVLDLGGYREEFKNAEDYELWLRISRTHRLANIPQPLLRYRFSMSGMTLGRKWQQMYYVYLAQAAHRHPDAEMATLHEEAKALLAATDRSYYFSQVLEGTLRELVNLHLWGDAYRLIWGFSREVGWRRSSREALSVMRSRWQSFASRAHPARTG
jgi:glycosyltransferase involved in cell wall biosynthesis